MRLKKSQKHSNYNKLKSSTETALFYGLYLQTFVRFLFYFAMYFESDLKYVRCLCYLLPL